VVLAVGWRVVVVVVRGWWSWVSVVGGGRLVAVRVVRVGVVGRCVGWSGVVVLGSVVSVVSRVRWSFLRAPVRTPAARGVLGRAAGNGRKENPAGIKRGRASF
jgi:hypothetical protein